MIKKSSEIIDQLMNLQKYGLPEGSKMGLKSFDENLTFAKGGCTDITGYPFYGKSLVLKEILMGLTLNEGWKHCIYMPDDGSDVEVLSNLMHKLTGKTFDQHYANAITEQDIARHSAAFIDSFRFIGSEHNLEPEAFWNYAKELKCNSAVIDSWNYMQHKGEPTSPDYLRKILSLRNRFMDANKMHAFTIIHPKNPDPKAVKDGNVKKPSVYDLMGGSEWNNNGKNIMVVHKDSKENHQPYQICIDKVKPKHYGKLGDCSLWIDWSKQRFYEYDAPLNKKTYAYGEAEIVVDPINKFQQKDGEPF
jgi:hypothetical protein